MKVTEPPKLKHWERIWQKRRKTILSGITDSPSLMFTVNTVIYSEHEGYRASETQTLGENMAEKT